MSFDTLPSGKVVHLPCGWPMAPSFPGQGRSPWPQRRCELASSMRTTPKWPNGHDGRCRMFCMIKSKHKQAHTCTQTKTREISGIIVGLEAQFVVTAKEGVFRLPSYCTRAGHVRALSNYRQWVRCKGASLRHCECSICLSNSATPTHPPRTHTTPLRADEMSPLVGYKQLASG